jgi:hypothetical protein
MVDTIITNVPSDDIRTLVRLLLSSSAPNVTETFCSIAKSHLDHSTPPPSSTARQPDFFTPPPDAHPTPAFESTLAKARARYGAGLGSASIRVLLPIVDLASSGELKWSEGSEGSELEEALSIVDCDIAAAVPYVQRELQRTGATTAEGEEQIAEELARRHNSAVETLKVLKEKLDRVESTAGDRGCDNPFERSLDAVNAIEY